MRHVNHNVSAILEVLKHIWSLIERTFPRNLLLCGMDVSLVRVLNQPWWSHPGIEPSLLVQNIRLPGLDDDVLTEHGSLSNFGSPCVNMIEINRCENVSEWMFRERKRHTVSRWGYLDMVTKYMPSLSNEQVTSLQNRLQKASAFGVEGCLRKRLLA